MYDFVGCMGERYEYLNSQEIWWIPEWKDEAEIDWITVIIACVLAISKFRCRGDWYLNAFQECVYI